MLQDAFTVLWSLWLLNILDIMDIFHCFQVVHLKLKDLEAAEPMTDPSTSPIFAASGMAWQDLGRSSKIFQDVPRCSTVFYRAHDERANTNSQKQHNSTKNSLSHGLRTKCEDQKGSMDQSLVAKTTTWFLVCRDLSPHAQLKNHLDEGGVSFSSVQKNVLKILETSAKAMFSEPFGTLRLSM